MYSALSGPGDCILHYIKTTFIFFFNNHRVKHKLDSSHNVQQGSAHWFRLSDWHSEQASLMMVAAVDHRCVCIIYSYNNEGTIGYRNSNTNIRKKWSN